MIQTCDSVSSNYTAAQQISLGEHSTFSSKCGHFQWCVYRRCQSICEPTTAAAVRTWSVWPGFSFGWKWTRTAPSSSWSPGCWRIWFRQTRWRWWPLRTGRRYCTHTHTLSHTMPITHLSHQMPLHTTLIQIPNTHHTLSNSLTIHYPSAGSLILHTMTDCNTHQWILARSHSTVYKSTVILMVDRCNLT